jgi:hypothetical protein
MLTEISLFTDSRNILTNIQRTQSYAFDICGFVHHHLINKTTNVMRFGAIVFIIPWKALYMFRLLFTPIIRSVLKPYM